MIGTDIFQKLDTLKKEATKSKDPLKILILQKEVMGIIRYFAGFEEKILGQNIPKWAKEMEPGDFLDEHNNLIIPQESKKKETDTPETDTEDTEDQ